MRRGFLGTVIAAVAAALAFGGADEPRSHAAPAANPTPPAEPQRPVTAARDGATRDVTPPDPRAGIPAAEPVDQVDDASCPEDMVLVEGEYCTDVRHTCDEWLDDQKLQFARCGKYDPEGTRCVGKRVTMRYCIDRYEYTAPGEDLPLNHQSFVKASKICKQQGKRICTESEWNFACEGPEMLPYPYGYSREPVCNQDRKDLYIQTPKERLLADHRQPATANDRCVSPFGVYNMVGNLDEPTLRDGAVHNHPFRTALKGGWWMAGRNRCRPATTAHDDYYEDIQVGVRCCADTAGSSGSPTG